MEHSVRACNNGNCPLHFHVQDLTDLEGKTGQQPHAQPEQQSTLSEEQPSELTISHEKGTMDVRRKPVVTSEYGLDNRGFRRIIKNFTPS